MATPPKCANSNRTGSRSVCYQGRGGQGQRAVLECRSRGQDCRTRQPMAQKTVHSRENKIRQKSLLKDDWEEDEGKRAAR